MRISVARTGSLPSEGELPDGWNDEGWDIDRWENDGGRSIGTRLGGGRDSWKNYF